jgi:hypothetical protein
VGLIEYCFATLRPLDGKHCSLLFYSVVVDVASAITKQFKITVNGIMLYFKVLFLVEDRHVPSCFIHSYHRPIRPILCDAIERLLQPESRRPYKETAHSVTP